MVGRERRVTLVGVTGGTHARPPESADSGPRRTGPLPGQRPQPGRPRGAWRIGTPVVVLLCGALFVVSAASPARAPTCARAATTDLASLVEDEADRVRRAAQPRSSDLDAEVAAAERRRRRPRRQPLPAPDRPSSRTRPGWCRAPAPGVTVTLSDAPEDVIDAATGDMNLLVVHQQDIQAVVNAMWKGGATAVTIAGPADRLHHRHQVRGQRGAAPGRALPAALRDRGGRRPGRPADRASTTTTTCRSTASSPTTRTSRSAGTSTLEDEVTAPAYDGLLDLTFAAPLDRTGRAELPPRSPAAR